MIDTVQLSKKAIEMRREGYSYSDIATALKISKTSVSNWVKNVRLTEEEGRLLKKNLHSKVGRGRLQASMTLRSRKIFKEKVSYENAEKEFGKNIADPLFMIGLGFYWTQGLKKGNYFQFMNSDPYILRIMLMWIEKYLGVSHKDLDFKIFVDISHKNGEYKQYWSRALGIPVDKLIKTIHLRPQKVKIDKEYNGSLSMSIFRIEILRKVLAWQKLAIRYYD